MRLITGTIKPTALEWLPALSNIAPPHIRRRTAFNKLYNSCELNGNSLLFNILQDLPDIRLNRRPPWTNREQNYSAYDHWRGLWLNCNVTSKHLVKDPCLKLKGFDLKRNDWSKLNRFRSGQRKCNYVMHKSELI